MRLRRLVVPLLVGALLGAPSLALAQSPGDPEEARSAPAKPAPSGPASASRPPAPRRLNLGAYTQPYGPPSVKSLLDAPRFESTVDVYGKAADTIALTAKMAWWMQDFEFTYGPTPGVGRAPTLQETQEFRPTPPPAANFLPLLDWLLKKAQKK